MKERYVISIKARKDIRGNEKEEWRYAGIDKCGSGDPCWCYYEHDCKSFKDVESAKKWFNEVRSFLLDSYYYEKADFDMKTLGIRKVIYKKVESL